MLRLTSTETAPLELIPGLRPPAVYLDYCIIADLAGTDEGNRLREQICARGTLYLSWAHLVELFSLGNGPTFQRILQFLKAFGPHFIIIDADSNSVIKRERDWKIGAQNPAVDEDFMRLLLRYWDGVTELSVGILLDAMAHEEDVFDEIKSLHTAHRNKLKALFDAERNKYKTDKTLRNLLNGLKYPPSRPFITRTVNLEMARACVRTQEEFTLSDGLDFEHTVVSVSYCNYVVLDRKWAARCKRLKLPKNETAAVFSGAEIDRLMAHMSGGN